MGVHITHFHISHFKLQMKQSYSGTVKGLETVCSYVWKFTQHSKYLPGLFSNEANPLVYTYLVGVGLNPPFHLQNCLDFTWHRFNKVQMLVHVDSITQLLQSMMWICHSTTSQKTKLIDWDWDLVSVDAFEDSELSNSVNYHHLTHHHLKKEFFLLFHSKWRS